MTQRERFLRTLRYEKTDRPPLYLAGPWQETLTRWRGEGLPAGVKDVHEYLGVKDYGYRMQNITPAAGPFPTFERRTVREEGDEIFYIDSYGRTVHDFKSTATIPEWVEFPVKEADDLRRYLDLHFDVANLDARFAPDWEDKARAAQARGDIIMIDGGCYYWTLRSIAGVDGASYLLYDCPELVDELCERYFTVVMEGLKRAVKIVTIDVIGFGEVFAFKTGPLLSPEMFCRFILPRYTKAMEFAHEHDIRLTWHDNEPMYNCDETGSSGSFTAASPRSSGATMRTTSSACAPSWRPMDRASSVCRPSCRVRGSKTTASGRPTGARCQSARRSRMMLATSQTEPCAMSLRRRLHGVSPSRRVSSTIG